MLYCFHYDPAAGKYGAVVINILKVFSVFFLIVAGILFMSLRRWNTQRSAKSFTDNSLYGGKRRLNDRLVVDIRA
jgi:hypothetical protein